MKKLTTIVASLLIAGSVSAAEKAPLTVDVYNADENSFHVNSTLVYGESEVLVVDTGFTKADALRIAAKILDTGKELKTIFISQADPDYYFGAEVLHELFPKAKIITTPAVKKVIEKKLAGKLAFWGPKLGANAPVKPFIPAAYSENSLTVDGYKVEIRGTAGVLAHRPYLWIPENKTLLGNVAIFANLHLWMADSQTEQSQQAWAVQLQEMQALNPFVVVPGHMKSGSKLNAESINYSLQYLQDFKTANKVSKDSEELIHNMTISYPDSQMSMALSIAAKVHKGEMAW